MEANQKGNATKNTTQPQASVMPPRSATTPIAASRPAALSAPVHVSTPDRVSSPNPVMAPGSALVQKSALESPQAPSTKTEEPNMMKQGVSAKKKGKGAVFGMILLGILAVGGISFGIWEMLEVNTQKEQLNSQINTLKQQNNELQDKLEDATSGPTTDIDLDIDTETSSADTTDYIYVAEWGLKIKIPENLTVTGYEYAMSAGYTSLELWGNTKDGQYFPDFANTEKNQSCLGSISRYARGAEIPMASSLSLVFSSGQFDYYYNHPQSTFSVDENERTWEVESVDAVEQMLSAPGSYLKI